MPIIIIKIFKFFQFKFTDDVSSLSGSESEPESNEYENGQNELSENNKSCPSTSINNKNNKKIDKKIRIIGSSYSDSSDTELSEELAEKKKLDALLLTASRHSKVFFENDDGDIFSIYRCLLHNKKDIPEVNDDMIAQAIASGRKHSWTVIMLGGGHFAAAVFQGNNQQIITKKKKTI